MKRLFWTIVLVLFMLSSACACADVIPLSFGELEFELPAELVPVNIEEAQANGVVCAAQSEDGALRLVVLVQGAKRSADTSTEALIARLAQGGSVELSKWTAIDGTEFAIACERASEGEKNLCFRTATAVLKGEQITFFIIDYDGTRSDLPERLVGSVKMTE